MASCGFPPGLAACMPPPGLGEEHVPDVGDVYTDGQPATIVSKNFASAEVCGDNMCFEDGVPATVTRTSFCRHCAAMHDKANVQSVEDRLQCEIMQTIGLLVELEESLMNMADKPAEEPALQHTRPSTGPFMVNSEHIIEGIIANSVMSWNEVSIKFSSLSNALLEARGLDDWEHIVAVGFDALALVDTIGACTKTSRSIFRKITRVMQNVIMLAITLGVTDEEFDALRLQGMTPTVKKSIGYYVYKSYMINTVEECQALMSRLGVAKYHLFNAGKKFSRRRKRVKMGKIALSQHAEPGAC